MKKLVLSLMGLFLFIFGYCYDIPSYNNTSYVNDYAKVFTNPNKIDALIRDIRAKTTVQITVVSITDLPSDATIEDYGLRLGRTWGVGDKSNNGLIVLFAVNAHKMRVEVGSGLEGIITDVVANDALEVMKPYFRENNFDEGVLSGLNSLNEKIIAGKEELINNSKKAQDKSSPVDYGSILYSLIFLCIIGGIYYLIFNYIQKKKFTKEKYKTAIINKSTELLNAITKLKTYEPYSVILSKVFTLYDISKTITSLQGYYGRFVLIIKNEEFTEENYGLTVFCDLTNTVKSFSTIENYIINYNSWKNKTNSDYLITLQNYYLWLEKSMLGNVTNFIDTNSIKDKLKAELQITINKVNAIVIDKTDYSALQLSINKLDDIVNSYNNFCKTYENKIIDGQKKVNLINDCKDNFLRKIENYKSLSKSTWASNPTRKIVDKTIENFIKVFYYNHTTCLAYDITFYNWLVEFFNDLDDRNNFKELFAEQANDIFLTNEAKKAEELRQRKERDRRRQEEEDNRRRQQQQDDDRRRNDSYISSSSSSSNDSTSFGGGSFTGGGASGDW
jgi:uncharacterized membrane protein YgcG